MPRRLKTYQTSLGFYDLAIAAPSMKAALEAWDAGSNLFHQGFAKETEDPDVVAATMAKPGVVLKRPAGSSGRFGEHAELPVLERAGTPKKGRRTERKKRAGPKISAEDARKAAAEFDRERKRRDAERRKEEAAREKERAKREKLVANAQAALDEAKEKHERRAQTFDEERRDLEKRIEAEDTRWGSEREKLKEALRRARE
ncbi:cell envelope biogenesis protein TolA [Bradyrhizobium sp.]|uniref:cell envelope biogenesis protein TolA n=1 Tax=Bradyrhizobium sp. TaxID=376 RepID=UPI0039E40F76